MGAATGANRLLVQLLTFTTMSAACSHLLRFLSPRPYKLSAKFRLLPPSKIPGEEVIILYHLTAQRAAGECAVNIFGEGFRVLTTPQKPTIL